MRYVAKHRRIPVALLWVTLLSVGCMEYEVTTRVNPDGSGVRTEKLVLEDGEDDELGLSPDAFKALMHLREADGFDYSEATSEDGDKTHVFTRETQIRSWDGWRAQSGRIQITAAAAPRSGARAGKSEYADVKFRNSLQLERRQEAEGRVVEYRERFYWNNLAGVLIDYELRRFTRFVETTFPRLRPEARGELIGLAKGALWATAQQGRWDLGDSERAEAFAPLVKHLADQALRLVRDRYPQASRESLAIEFRRMLVELEEDEDFESFLERNLPGAVLAGNTQLVVRLHLPGQVLESNAHERDGATLKWEFSPWDAVLLPVELFARSRVAE